MPVQQHEDAPRCSLSLEGRLLAHRRLLAELVHLLPADRRAALAQWLDERANFQDGQEDPGAVPAEGIELELARADEFRMLGQMISSATGQAP